MPLSSRFASGLASTGATSTRPSWAAILHVAHRRCGGLQRRWGVRPTRPSLTGGSHLRAAELGSVSLPMGWRICRPSCRASSRGHHRRDIGHRSASITTDSPIARHRHQWRDGARPCRRVMGYVHGCGPGFRGCEHRVRHARGAWGRRYCERNRRAHHQRRASHRHLWQRTRRSGELPGAQWRHRQERPFRSESSAPGRKLGRARGPLFAAAIGRGGADPEGCSSGAAGQGRNSG